MLHERILFIIFLSTANVGVSTAPLCKQEIQGSGSPCNGHEFAQLTHSKHRARGKVPQARSPPSFRCPRFHFMPLASQPDSPPAVWCASEASFRLSEWTPWSRGWGEMGVMQVCLSEGVISNHKERGDTKSKPNQTINVYALVSSHLSIPWSRECVCQLSPPPNCDLMKAFSFSKMVSGRETGDL